MALPEQHVPRTVPLTAADESYSHQLVAPMAQPLYQSPAWGDRCYHLLHVDGLTINAGRQLYVNDQRRYAFFGVASANTPSAGYGNLVFL